MTVRTQAAASAVGDAAFAGQAWTERVLGPELVRPEEFGPALAGQLARPGARLLLLACVPGLPGAPRAPGGYVVAFLEAPAGEVWPLAARADQAPSRPSAAGVAGTQYEEARLAAGGVRWAEPAPAAPVRGRGVFTFPLGPVRGDVAESAGWRFEVMGDEVLGLRLRFGYKRRGLEERMSAAAPDAGVAVAERVTGTSPLAHATAFSMAWERARGEGVPPAAVWWRGVLAEVERLHSHLADLAALAASTGLPVAAAELLLLRERVLRLCLRVSGHRYLRGVVGPGGLRQEPRADESLVPTLQKVAGQLPAILRALDGSTSFLDRLHGAGRLDAHAARALAPVGPVGRASGGTYDVRRDRPYGLYAGVGAPPVAWRREGDAWARYRVRVAEVWASLDWLGARLGQGIPRGERGLPDRGAPPPEGGIGLGRVEGPRGELVYAVYPGGDAGPPWVRLRPASAANWPALPLAVAAGNVLQDVPIIEASFALSVSALDR